MCCKHLTVPKYIFFWKLRLLNLFVAINTKYCDSPALLAAASVEVCVVVLPPRHLVESCCLKATDTHPADKMKEKEKNLNCEF